MYTPALVRVRYPPTRLPPAVVTADPRERDRGRRAVREPEQQADRQQHPRQRRAHELGAARRLLDPRQAPAERRHPDAGEHDHADRRGGEQRSRPPPCPKRTRGSARRTRAGSRASAAQRTPKNTTTPISHADPPAIGIAAPTTRATPSAISAESTMMLKPAIILHRPVPEWRRLGWLRVLGGELLRVTLVAGRDASPRSGGPGRAASPASASPPPRPAAALTVAWRHCPAAALDVHIRRRRRLWRRRACGRCRASPGQAHPSCAPRRSTPARSSPRIRAAISSVELKPSPNSCRSPSAAGAADGGQPRRGQPDEVDDPADHVDVDASRPDRGRDELERSSFSSPSGDSASETVPDRHGYGRGRLWPHSARRTRSALPLQIFSASASPYRVRRWAWSCRHPAHVLEAGQRGLDVAVEVRADRDVVVAPGQLVDLVDVPAQRFERALERVHARQPAGDEVLAHDAAEHAAPSGDGLDRLVIEVYWSPPKRYAMCVAITGISFAGSRASSCAKTSRIDCARMCVRSIRIPSSTIASTTCVRSPSGLRPCPAGTPRCRASREGTAAPGRSWPHL